MKINLKLQIRNEPCEGCVQLNINLNNKETSQCTNNTETTKTTVNTKESGDSWEIHNMTSTLEKIRLIPEHESMKVLSALSHREKASHEETPRPEEHPGELKYRKKEEQKQQEGDEQEEEKHWEEEQEQCGHEEENIIVQHERSDHDSARRAEAEHITDTVAPWEQHGAREILLG